MERMITDEGEGILIHLPSREVIEEHACKSLTDGELSDMYHYIRRGIETIIDWDALINSAIDSTRR